MVTQLQADGSQRLVDERLQRFDVLRSIFTALDRSKDGKLSMHELSAAFELFGFGMMDRDELQTTFNEFDQDRSGYVEFAEFAQMITRTMQAVDVGNGHALAASAFRRFEEHHIKFMQLNEVRAKP